MAFEYGVAKDFSGTKSGSFALSVTFEMPQLLTTSVGEVSDSFTYGQGMVSPWALCHSYQLLHVAHRISPSDIVPFAE